MNTIKKLSLVLVATVFCVAAFAQNGLNYFEIPRAVVLANPQLISGGGAGPQTNGWVDLRQFDGVSRIDIFCCTNVGNTSMTATLETSLDTTNASAVTYALATGKTVNITNWYYGGTNLYVANTYNLPGTVTTPSAATAGFATPYLLPAPFTNTAAITISANTTNGICSVGVDTDSLKRYIRIYFTPGGAATNTSVGAIMVGRVQQTPAVP